MTSDAPTRPSIRYETPVPKVARIWLDRADTRNAQDTRLLYELNDAFDRAAQDDDVSVIVLAAEGPHFSSGHDLRERDGLATMQGARDRRHVVRLRVRRRRGPDVAREGDLRRLLRAVAEHPQADDRGRPGQGHRRRVDARVAVRHHRRRRQRRVHRQHRRHGGVRCRVLPPPVGGRHPAGQGDAVHVGRRDGRGRVPARDGQPRRRRSTTCSPSPWPSPRRSPSDRCSRSS